MLNIYIFTIRKFCFFKIVFSKSGVEEYKYFNLELKIISKNLY